MAYFCDYPKEPVGGKNPYYRCVHCQRTDPQINGKLEGHSVNCLYRLEKQNIIAGLNLQTKWFLLDENFWCDQNDLEDLSLRIIGWADNKELESKVLEQLLEMEIGKAKLIENKRVVKILVPWD